MTAMRCDALLVDDEADLCWALRRALEDEGLSVVEAHSLAEARTLLLAEGLRPRCVLLDARFPDGDGLAFAAELRALDPAIAVLLLSGLYFQFDGDVREALRTATVAGFFGKPVPIAELRRTVLRVLERR